MNSVSASILRRVTMGLLFLIAGVLIYRLAESQFNDGFWPFILALGVPVLMVGGSWALLQSYRDKIDLTALQQSVMAKPVINGDWSAVSGVVQPLEPLSEINADLVAYRYQIIDKENRSTRDRHGNRARRKIHHIRAEGYFQAPVAIETALGAITIRGFLDLRHLDKGYLSPDIQKKCREQAIEQPRWPPKFILRKQAFIATEDRLDIDWNFIHEDTHSESSCNAKVLKKGDQVTVFGVMQNTALVAGKFPKEGLTVYSGSTEELLTRLQGDASAFKSVGIVSILIAAGLMIWISI